MTRDNKISFFSTPSQGVMESRVSKLREEGKLTDATGICQWGWSPEWYRGETWARNRTFILKEDILCQ